MGHAGRVVGMAVVGCLAASQLVAAQEVRMPIAGWVIEAADYSGRIEHQIARLEATYTIRLVQDGWVEVPLALPGATVTDIVIARKAGEAHLAPRGSSYALVASRKGIYQVRVACSALVAQDSQFEGVQLQIPQATFSTMTLTVPRADVELRPADQLYVERKPEGSAVTLIAKVGAATAIDLRWRIKPAAPEKVEPVIYGEAYTLATLEEQLSRIMSILEYRIAQGEVRQLQVRLPGSMNVLNVRGPAIEDWKVTEAGTGKQLTVTLAAPLKDANYRLVIEGEETIAKDSAGYTLPEVRLEGVKQERGYLAVARVGSLELAPQTVDGLLRVDVKELPEVLRVGGPSPALLAFRYHQHPYQAVLALTRHEDHPVLSAVAEQGELVTVVSRQGELLTRAGYLIKANKKQFVEARLPEGSTLWSCIVDGKSVKPVKGEDGSLLIPLDASGDSAQAVSVELVYFESRPTLSGIGRMALRGPVLDVPTTVANWFVYTPRQVKLLRVSGNLDPGASDVEFLDGPVQPMVVAMAGSFIAGGKDEQRLYADAGAVRRELAQGRDDRDGWLGLLSSGERKRGLVSRLMSAQAKPEEEYAARYMAADLVSPAATGPYGQASANEPFEGDNKEDRWSGAEKQKSNEDILAEMNARLQQTGILPLKIRLPKSGTMHRFNRLMASQEALELDATFVALPHVTLPLAGIGLFFVGSISGLAWLRLIRV